MKFWVGLWMILVLLSALSIEDRLGQIVVLLEKGAK